MNYFHEKLPEIGQKFVAVFDDGSGAYLFKRIEDDDEPQFIDNDNVINGTERMHENFLFWLPLPDDFMLWFEGCDK